MRYVMLVAACWLVGSVAGGQETERGENALQNDPAPKVTDSRSQAAKRWPATNEKQARPARQREKLRQQLHVETKVQFIDTPLEEVMGYLHQLHDISFVLDEPTLKQDFDPAELQRITMNLEHISLRTGLDLLTERYGLGWYLQEEVLVITSAEKAETRLTTRVYPVQGFSPEALAETIRKTIRPDSWAGNGGKADVAVARENNLLVVRQNQAGHNEVEDLLRDLQGVQEAASEN